MKRISRNANVVLVLSFLLLLPLSIGLSPSIVLAQSKTDAGQSSNEDSLFQRIKAVSAKSKKVDSAKGFSEIVAECDALLAEELQKKSHRTYLKTLLAWALDQRASSRLDLASQFSKIGNAQQAEQIENQAILDFDRAIENDSKRWQTFMHRGTFLSEKEDYSKAIDNFSKVIELNPKKTAAYFNRAELRYQLNQFKEAKSDYDAVLKDDGQDVQAISGRAHCLLALNQATQAIQDYDLVIELSPNDAWAYANRADGQLALSKWTEAKVDLEKANQLRPNGELLRRLAWFLSTCPDESLCDGTRALALAKRAIQLSGETMPCLDTLAAAHAAAGQFEQARDVYARAIAMQESDDPDSQIKQAAYENNQRYQEKFDR